MNVTIQDLRDVADIDNGFDDLILSPGDCRQLASQFDALEKRLEAAERVIETIGENNERLRDQYLHMADFHKSALNRLAKYEKVDFLEAHRQMKEPSND